MAPGRLRLLPASRRVIASAAIAATSVIPASQNARWTSADRVEHVAECVSDEPVEVGRQDSVGPGELAQVHEEI